MVQCVYFSDEEMKARDSRGVVICVRLWLCILIMYRTRSRLGDRAFAATAGPPVWNSLMPVYIMQRDSTLG